MEQNDIRGVLKRYWGFDRFRPLQEEVIRTVLADRDALVLMPTGGGKSLIYQVPTLAREGLCVVVTPLIALMKDQVDRLRARGIGAVAIHAGLSPRQIDVALDNCAYDPKMKFLYIAPERIASETLRLRLPRMNVRLIAVDEAHCISQWGYDFRPAYRQIAELRERCPEASVLALTASATGAVAEDIMQNLHFDEKRIFRGDFSRPNLSYAVRHTEDKNGQLLRIAENVPGSGIVYVRTREATEEIAAWLRQEGITAAAYNGGLPHTERALRQEEWMSGKVRVMVATNAFGMGIDKADVRFVVHYTLCDSLENYYQEAGRAGRDGARSYALLLVSPEDPDRVRRRFEADFPPLESVKDVYDKIGSYLRVEIGEGDRSSHTFNIHDFCAREHLYHGKVKSALELLEQNGYMSLSDEMENPARIIFCISRDDLYRIRCEKEELDPFIRTILRLYNGVFTEFRKIDELEIARWSGYTVERVKELLKRLWQMRIIRYIPSNRSPMITFLTERLPRADLYISPESYKFRRELTLERFDRMLRYAENDRQCRSALMEAYFGVENPADCGVCDLCLERKRRQRRSDDLSGRILNLLEEGALDVRELVARLACDPGQGAEAIDELLASAKISQLESGKVVKNR
ncbi:ATP-dependent DNA helicase RecQ [uncultured Alistipes sp.]|uniref:RecQ family ATP-dependent DNA helicase n=1 Tax=uncultured Alistipes sp. TaxID=538949 RepID=UPI0032B1FA92